MEINRQFVKEKMGIYDLKFQKEVSSDLVCQHLVTMNKRITMKFNLLIENKTKWILLAIFGASILSKIFIIPKLGAVWFPYSDEHIYIELAKNIFFHQNMVSNVFYYIKQYSEFLYPLLLSPLYLFYSPDNIITLFRIFGLITMSSAVFPSFQLALAVLRDKKQALLASVLAILIPEMTLVFSVVQEVIYYPLFLFVVYLIYQKICGIKINPVFIGTMLFLLWSCKAIGATLFVGYIIFLFYELIFINKFRQYKSYIIHILVVAIVVFGLKEIFSILITYANYGSFITESDYYTSAIMSTLNAPIFTFISDIINGLLYYLFFTTVVFFVFPLILPFDNFQQYNLDNRKFLIFLTITFLVTIATVVVLIYKMEGGTAREMQRVHIRYLFPYLIPFLIMTLKLDFKRVKLKLFGIIYLSFLVIYYLLFDPYFTRGSIIDAKSLLLVEKIQNNIINGSNIVFLFIFLMLILLGYFLYKNNEKIHSKSLFNFIVCITLFINQGYAIFSTFRNYTKETNAIVRRNEYSTLSKLLDTKPGTPLLINTNNGLWNDVLFTTQSKKDFIEIFSSENPLEYVYDSSVTPNFLITPKNLYPINQIHNLQLLETELTLFNVYELSSTSTNKIKFDYMLMNTYTDNWLMENAMLLLPGVEGKNQIEISLELGTSDFPGKIEAILTDSTGNISNIPVSPNGSMITLTVKKNPSEKNYSLSFCSNGYFIPAELGINEDGRKLTYFITDIKVH